MVPARPPISNSSSPLIKTLEIVLSESITFDIPTTFIFRSFFFSFVAWSSINLSFRFLWLWSPGTPKLTILQVLLFFSGLLVKIRWSVSISENLMHFIFEGGFWFAHILFGTVVKFQFLVPFSVDPLPCLILYCIIIFLRSFATFAYDVINCFVSIIK